MVCDNTNMNILKKSLLGLCASFLVVLLFIFGITLGLYQVFGTPDPLKNALRESGFYESIVGDALDQAQKQQPTDQQNEIPVDNPEVQNLIKSAVSPEILQSQLEGSLDSFYAWMRGETPKLVFSVELGDAKNKLAANVGTYIEERMATLPQCASNVAPSEDLDPFNATCLPRGVTAAQIASQAKNELLSGEFLKDTTVTADSLKGKDGKSVEQQLQSIPAVYKAVQWALYGSGALALLMAVAVVFLSVNWRSGLKKISVVCIAVGGVSVLFSWLAAIGLSRASEFATEPLQQSGVKIAQALGTNLQTWWMWYGIILIVFGLITLLVLHFTKQKEHTVDALEPSGEAIPAPKIDDSRTQPTERPKQKSRPIKKLVQ